MWPPLHSRQDHHLLTTNLQFIITLRPRIALICKLAQIDVEIERYRMIPIDDELDAAQPPNQYC